MSTPEELVRQLIIDRTLETDRVERTVSETDTDKFAEAACSFANDLPGRGLPGYLFIGVRDDGQVVGVKNAAKLLSTLGGLRTDGNILPPPVMAVSTVQMPDERTVVAVEVQPSDRPPVYFKGRIHVRIGARRGFATAEEERRLSERATDRARTWDMRACREATLDDLALELFSLGYLHAAVSAQALLENGRPIEAQLAALRFFDLRKNRPTNGAVLLFGKDPLTFFPGAYVQYVHYSTTDQAGSVVESRRLAGDLLSVMRELDQLAIQLSGERPERQPDLTDRAVYDYPPVAMHELFMNSMIHRNYDSSTTPTFINRYEDRVEILNPGSLYGDLSAASFPGGTAYRNPVIAEAARTLGYVNRFGRGIALAYEHLERNGSRPVEFKPAENFFLATVWKRP